MTLRNRDWQAMPKMCEFTRIGGDTVYVNPTNVWYVRPGSPGHTVVHFSDDELIVLMEEPPHVVSRLNLAMNEDGTR